MIFKSFSYYLLGTVIASGISFLMMPILTRLLSPYDYGMIATVGIIIQFVGLFALNIGSLIVREASDNIELLKDIFSAFIIQILTIGLILEILSIKFDNEISNFLGITNGYIGYIVLISVLTTLQGLFFSTLQAYNLAKRYAFLSITVVVLNMSLTLILLNNVDRSWISRLDAMFYSLLIILVYLIIFAKKKHLLTRPTKNGFNEINKFGIPLIPHAIGGLVILSVDKYYLNTMVGVSETGIYSVALVLMGILMILIESFNKAILPYMMKKLKNINFSEKITIVRYIYLYDFLIIIAAIVSSYLSNFLLQFYVGENFIKADQYLSLLYISAAFIGMYRMRVIFIIYKKETKKLSYRGDVLAAIINILLCPYLINLNGPIGAAQSTMVAYFISFISVWVLSNEIYPMPWLLKEKN